MAIAMIARPLLPIDETRYLSVAWEMWQRRDWITPYLNGLPYSDKPPLLFWYILSGWSLFGVTEWWPRLLSPLAGLASVLLLAYLARRLWPPRADAAALTLPFLSGMFWMTYTTLVLFDTLLTVCVLISLSGVVEAYRGKPRWGWLAYGAGIGLGLLAKGPVVLIHTLPVALLAPWWTIEEQPVSWRAWYFGMAVGAVLGIALGLSWALTAGLRAGPAYQTAILWGQSAGRLAKAFAHQRPWWWYLPIFPIILFPWAWWPPLWRSMRYIWREPAKVPVRFSLSCIVPAVVAFSLISGKQIHYLMPLLPTFAILAGVACARLENRRPVVAVSLISPTLLIIAHLALRTIAVPIHDLQPIASFLKAAEDTGRPVAYVGRYAGQFHFLGRLRRPFDQIRLDQRAGWLSAHTKGLVIQYERSEAATAGATFVWPYRDGMIGIWGATAGTGTTPRSR